MQRPALLLAVAFAYWVSGCTAPVISGVAAVAEYGTSTFNSGALQTYYPNRFIDTVVAVRTAISQLGLRPVSDVPQEHDAFVYIKAVDETGTEVWFRVRRRGEMLTMVSIRVGLLGDEPYATALTKHVTALLDPDATHSTPPPDLRLMKGETLPPNPLQPADARDPRPPEPPPEPPEPRPQ